METTYVGANSVRPQTHTNFRKGGLILNTNAPTWTPEQLSAIETRGCNLLVAAAAGSGKTAVLVERIIRKVTDEKNPVDIDKLLIVTFTNAAATEMRERIGDAIAKALEANPGSRQLQRQLSLLHKATITTIHSFCLEVIKSYFHTIDLDPNFRIANETEAVLMKLEALEELFEEKYETAQPDDVFFQLVECYGGNKDDKMLQDMVYTLRDYVQSSPWPEQWLRQQAEAFQIDDCRDFSQTQWGKVLIDNIKIELQGILASMNNAVDMICKSEGLDSYIAVYQEDMDRIKMLLSKCDDGWDVLYQAFSSVEFSKLPRCGKNADKTVQSVVKSIRDEAKKQFKKMREEVVTSFSREIIGDLSKLYPLMNGLCNLVLEYNDRYALKKKERALIDFNDLEHYCLDILTVKDGDSVKPSEVAKSFREQFEEIMVDEYQDSNMVQEVIIHMISRQDAEAPNVFMVGDVKQSIYRFRQARPELFMDKYHTYSEKPGDKNRKIKLNKNFRSRHEIIHGVNHIFKQIMSSNVGEVDYTDEEALNPGAQFEEPESSDVMVGGEIELHLIDLNEELQSNDELSETTSVAEEQEQEDELDQIQLEARLVAQRIQQLVSPDEAERPFYVYDKNKKGYRPVTYKDIVVLLRTTKNWANVFVEEFTLQGIPAYADTGTGFFMSVEVQTVISLLQIIDNPMQDIPLLAVLRSPVVSITPEELIDIRLTDREAPLYEAVKKFASSNNCDTANKLNQFLSQLKKWRTMAAYMSTDELIWQLYTDTGYYSYVGIMPGGAQRQANLRVLFERARQYEETSFKGLFNFIQFINKLKSSQGDMGSAKILGENENVVRIMSIHKSKGLEFPVVFVSGIGKKFNLQDMNRSIILHQDLGLGPDFVDFERRISYPTVAKQAIRYRIKKESLSEEMRILYVALTRAKEKLIITGTVKDFQKAKQDWHMVPKEAGNKIPEFITMKAGSFLDWIGVVAEQSDWKIQVWNRNRLYGLDVKAEGARSLEDFKSIELRQKYSEYEEEIKRRLDWNYPYQMSPILPVKISVTEIKRHYDSEFSDEYSMQAFIPPLVKQPLFLEKKKGLSAAEKGTALHFVMQHLDLNHVMTADQIHEQIHRMVENQLLTPEQASSVDVHKIVDFFRTPLGQRMLSSGNVKREVPFNIHIKCKEIYDNLPKHYEDEAIILQGVIDCYFEEKDGIVLVDYKTDYVEPGGEQKIKEKYAVQLEYYSKALEYITGCRVKERFIYLFWNSSILKT